MIALILLQVTQAANEAAAAVEPEGVSLDFWELALKGGWIMVPLFLLSLIALFIFGDRYFAIHRASKFDTNLMNQIRQHIQDGKIDSALVLCKSTDKPITRMIEKGILRIGRPLNDVSAAIDNVGNLEVSKLEKGLPLLASVAGGAPMIGFLGTVMGMIQAFYDMANAGNNIDVTLLSSGIYQAMVTTVAGLIVGIVAYFAYNILVSRVEKVVFKMEATTTDFMDLLNEPAQ
ncbi:MAG: MotA/TolQ/ExbB proton channel family protein [Prolixibacteraceae bacterium]|nr:MotA/TolQ/ExbB proton channel family protein [Prolixibacteraceae bacterium]